MANRGASNLGGILGGVLGLAIVVAIIALPLYGSLLESDEARLREAVREPTEQIRRVILNLDESTSAFADQYQSLGDKKPSLGDFQRHMSDNDKLLTAAREALSKSENQVFGEASSGSSLELNRAKALLKYAHGRLDANRADFELYQARTARRQAEALALPAATALVAAAESESNKPDDALTAITAELATCEVDISATTTAVEQLANAVVSQKARIMELQSQAESLRAKLFELETSGAAVHDESSGYAEASDEVRRVEAELDALRFGTYAGGEVRTNDLGDLITAEYSGGQPAIGLRALEHALQTAEDVLAGLKQKRESLLAQQDNFRELASEFSRQAGTNRTAGEDVLADVRARLGAANAALSRADKASQAALQSLDAAMRSAKAASAAAARRQNDARMKRADADAMEAELLGVIAGDEDLKCSIDCLAADIAYQIALIHGMQMEALREQARSEQFIASLTAQPAPAPIDGRLDELRNAAIARVEEAASLYEAAAGRLKNFRVSLGGKTVQGKDVVWQVEVAQAAVHLLHAQLLEDADTAFTQKEKAYTLLTSAVQGREQSPLLGPAIAMLRQLQESVK